MYAGKKSGAAEAFAMEKTRMEICSTVPFYRRSERWRRIKQALPAALHKAKGVLWGDRAWPGKNCRLCARNWAAVQALVQRVVWDGESAHVVLAGTAEVPADFLCAEEGRTEREERSEAHGDGNTQFVNTPAPHWREDSK